MGGLGSGRLAGWSDRRTTEDLPALDVRAAKRKGLIAPEQEELVVPGGTSSLALEWTPSGFGAGGSGFPRPWFVCPGDGCGRRAAILYLEGRRLLCRICLDLAYPSQREGRLGRARRHADKARRKLGPEPVAKPKGMHHRTFVRLGREYLAAVKEQRALYDEWGAKLSDQFARRNSSL